MGQVTVTKIVEGPGHLVIRLDLSSDGSGELSDEVILSPSDLTPPKPNNIPAFRVMQIWYNLVWFDVIIKAGTINAKPVWTLARDSGNHADFRSFGGLLDLAAYSNPPSDTDGKLTISTNDFATAGSVGSLIIELQKTGRAAA